VSGYATVYNTRSSSCLDAAGSSVDSSEVGLSQLAVRELTEAAAQSLSVDDAVVRGVGEVDVDAASLALRHRVPHHPVCAHTTHHNNYQQMDPRDELHASHTV